MANSESDHLLPRILEQVSTPSHLYFEDRALEDARALSGGLRRHLPQLKLFYSTKTNALSPLLGALLREGWKLETVAPADRVAAAEAGAKGADLLLNGAAWTNAELKDALYGQRIRRVNLDSPDAAARLGACLRAGGPLTHPLEVGFRLHDGNSHFGFAFRAEDFRAALGHLPSPSIATFGLHIHVNPPGSAQNAQEIAADFRARAKKLIEGAAVLADAGVRSISFADLGGGIDSPWIYRPQPAELGKFHHPGEVAALRAARSSPRFTLAEAGEAIGRAIAEEFGARRLLDWEISLEPGRAVCTRALSTVIEVLAIKPGFYPDAQVALTNGSTAFLGPLHRAIHPVRPLYPSPGPDRPAFIYGNLPHSGDWLFQSYPLPPLRVGDRLLIEHTGAYFLALESKFGFPLPAIHDARTGAPLRLS